MTNIIERARRHYVRDKAYWSQIYDKAREDMRFLSDDENAQWNEKEASYRRGMGRPVLTIDQLGQFVHQVSNDIRMNTPTINIIPAGDESDIETAEIFKGLIKNIEYVSKADEAYDTASLNAIKCSIGFIRVDHDYVDGESFEQHLTINRVVDPLACWIDCDSVEADGSDAKHGMMVESLLVSEFKARYPKAQVSSFGDEDRQYKEGDTIRIAEYYEMYEEKHTVGLTASGEVEACHEDGQYTQHRVVKKPVVKHYILSGKEVLQEATFPGRYIPIVPVYGEEAWVEGKRELYSLIRKSKDAQRMYNFWKSLETELLMKQPHAPVIAAEGQTDLYAEDWKHPSKAMVLRYNPYDLKGNPAPRPERLAPPTIPTGIVNAAQATVDDIKATMGLYNASIGAMSNETSGVAISRRKEEGDVATYHFGDNLVRSIAHVGKILVAAIPAIYDTARVIRIIGEEDEPKQVGVNGQMIDAQERPFDLRKGKYDVRVITGAPFTTKRQEAAEFFSNIVSQQPELMSVMGDLMFKNMDFAGAQAMAERMKKVVDPKFLEESTEQATDPEKEQMAATLAELQGQLVALQKQLDDKRHELELKARSEANRAMHEDKQIDLELAKAKLDYDYKMASLQMKAGPGVDRNIG